MQSKEVQERRLAVGRKKKKRDSNDNDSNDDKSHKRGSLMGFGLHRPGVRWLKVDRYNDWNIYLAPN